jgi:hypothetical protein
MNEGAIILLDKSSIGTLNNFGAALETPTLRAKNLASFIALLE